jgi:predicted ATPase with chaperone activity
MLRRSNRKAGGRKLTPATRTLADLDVSENLQSEHLSEAIQYRTSTATSSTKCEHVRAAERK